MLLVCLYYVCLTVHLVVCMRVCCGCIPALSDRVCPHVCPMHCIVYLRACVRAACSSHHTFAFRIYRLRLSIALTHAVQGKGPAEVLMNAH